MSGNRRWKQAPPHPDHTAVLADLDPQFYRLPLGIPAASSGKVKCMAAPARGLCDDILPTIRRFRGNQ